ncbi:MAG: hypothetical protein H7Y43_11025 [Akkermansiaceae bacterium]|nr:hypothetical protein [Verrucomicrobiales bacterium]
MKPFLSGMFRAAENLCRLVVSRTTQAQRAVLKTEVREREAREAERLDRLRNPQDYRGR